jgi:CRISPR/Cas system Type II protein with McrA/HNH and RuvC-like nuclease domain
LDIKEESIIFLILYFCIKNTIGLDLGSNSIGWAVVLTDEENQPEGIENVGCRIIPMSREILIREILFSNCGTDGISRRKQVARTALIAA